MNVESRLDTMLFMNPIERLWKFIKDKLAWQLWADLDELTSEIEFHIRQLTKSTIASLTGWDSILNALCVSLHES